MVVAKNSDGNNTLTYYAIELYRSGNWRPDSVHETREAALAEAKSVAKSGTCSGLRVIQQTSHLETGRISRRSIAVSMPGGL